jgi:DNA-binding response OmpR family regulator/Tfp pilus assembly protein PilZ
LKVAPRWASVQRVSVPTQRGPRLGVRRPVRFYRIDELVSAYSDDLSDRGVFVRTDAWLPVNGVVELCLVLPDDALVVPARVAYCLPPEQATPLGRRAGIGFQFLDPALPAFGRLRAYFERIKRDRWRARDVRKKRVLIACAHPRLQKRLLYALSTEGVSVRLVETAEHLAHELSTGAWDALVLDESTAHARNLPELRRTVATALPPLLYLCPSHDELARLHAYRAGVTECLPRPFTDEELRLRLRQLVIARHRKLTPDLAGSLSRMPVASVLNLIEHERLSGVLTLQGDGEQVSLCLHEGQVSAVDGGELSEPARARALGALRWDRGYYEFRSADVVTVAGDGWSVTALLLEGAQLEDEAAADSARAAGFRFESSDSS